MKHTLLLVDDEQDILDLLTFNLQAEGFATLTASEGEEAIRLAHEHKPDLILLDVMLPGKDGWAVLRELRNQEATRHIPVIFLTAKDNEIDEVVGLELGADDYIVKPISIRKLITRIKVALRKEQRLGQNQELQDHTLRFGELEIDPDSYLVRVRGEVVKFTKKEFELIHYLASRPGRVITRDTLLNAIWGYDVVVIDRTIDVHIRKIREKLGEEFAGMIETVKGVGYRMQAGE